MRRRTLVALVLVLLLPLLPAASARAQAPPLTLNPTTVEFTASPDHAATGLDGQPVVTNYVLRVYVSTDVALSTVVATLDIGKPAPNTQNTISVTNAVWFAALTPRTKYVATVAAKGPSGEGVSAVSNPFGNQGPPAAGGTPNVVRK